MVYIERIVRWRGIVIIEYCLYMEEGGNKGEGNGEWYILEDFW